VCVEGKWALSDPRSFWQQQPDDCVMFSTAIAAGVYCRSNITWLPSKLET
jgi:hypothetical protein